MTTVQLFGDIGLYANYKQTVDFSTITEQNAWFNGKTHTTINNVNYNKAYNSLKLNIDYGTALQYTYCRLLNLDSTNRIYYYFVTNVNVIDDNTVEFILEMDVFQTFMTYWSLKESMVNRAHVDRWGSGTNPIRITPNTEGIDGLYESEYLQNLLQQSAPGIQFVFMVVEELSHAELRLYIAPVYTNAQGTNYPLRFDTEISTPYPVMSDFVTNRVLSLFEIDPESVLAICVSPISPVEYTIDLVTGSDPHYAVEFNTQYQTKNDMVLASIDFTGYGDLKGFFFTSFVRTVNDSRPTKPVENDTASDIYEPALYLSPYRIRQIVNATRTIDMEVPDNFITDTPNITSTLLISASSQYIAFLPGRNIDTTDGGKSAQFLNAQSEGLMNTSILDTIDVFSNAWLTYSLTQRDSDRQILANNAISNVLQGAIFGSYGGALVTSRGTGGKDKRSIGQMATRMAPGIALGGLASAGSAIIDSHFAWENQNLEDRKIRNKASTVSISGSNGAINVNYGLNTPYYQVMKCDDTNYQRAYDNFRKYGYLINQFTTLDIRSRKYFNYVMTNGAVIGGSLPEDARSIIASAFDGGITIFHGDYSSTLEYPTYENIERSLM